MVARCADSSTCHYISRRWRQRRGKHADYGRTDLNLDCLLSRCHHALDQPHFSSAEVGARRTHLRYPLCGRSLHKRHTIRLRELSTHALSGPLPIGSRIYNTAQLELLLHSAKHAGFCSLHSRYLHPLWLWLTHLRRNPREHGAGHSGRTTGRRPESKTRKPTPAADMANDEINVPSLVLILVVSGFLIRHIFFRNTSSSSSATGDRGSFEAGAAGQHGQSRDQRRAEALDRRTEAAVEHVQQIFPYADRREVWWDLRRNGLNVAATTERILAGRLETVRYPSGPVKASPKLTFPFRSLLLHSSLPRLRSGPAPRAIETVQVEQRPGAPPEQRPVAALARRLRRLPSRTSRTSSSDTISRTRSWKHQWQTRR